MAFLFKIQLVISSLFCAVPQNTEIQLVLSLRLSFNCLSDFLKKKKKNLIDFHVKWKYVVLSVVVPEGWIPRWFIIRKFTTLAADSWALLKIQVTSQCVHTKVIYQIIQTNDPDMTVADIVKFLILPLIRFICIFSRYTEIFCVDNYRGIELLISLTYLIRVTFFSDRIFSLKPFDTKNQLQIQS